MFSFLKKARERSRPQCTALVAAAGASSRMGGVNKLLEPLDDNDDVQNVWHNWDIPEEQ